MVYFGFSLIAVASFLFAAFCPLEIKRCGSSEEYIAGNEPFISDLGLVSIEQALMEGDTISQCTYKDITATHNQRPSPDILEEIRHRARGRGRMNTQLYYEALDRSRLLIRLIAMPAYADGLLSLSVPALNVFYRVSVVLMRAIGL